MKYLLLFLLVFPGTLAFVSTQITSNKITVDYETRKFTFVGNTHLASSEITLTSDRLFYSPEILQASGNLILTQKTQQIRVKAEQLERKGSTIRIFTPNGRVSSEDLKNNRTVDSQSIFVDQKQKKWGKIHFQGTPNLTGQNFKATAQNEIIYDEGEGAVFFSGISRFEDQDQKSKIQSKDIIFREASQNLLFNSPVNITDDQNHFLSANRGDYNLNNKLLNLNGNVEYIGDVAVIHSDKLRTESVPAKDSTQKKLIYYFEDNIKLDYQSFQGTSKQIKVDPAEKYTELIGDVRLRGKNNNLRIRSNIMTISEKEKQSRFYDHVRFDVGKQHFRSNVAYYDDKTGIFTLTGNAHYEDGASRYDAQQIFLDNRTLAVRFVGMVSGLSSLENLKGIQVQPEE